MHIHTHQHNSAAPNVCLVQAPTPQLQYKMFCEAIKAFVWTQDEGQQSV